MLFFALWRVGNLAYFNISKAAFKIANGTILFLVEVVTVVVTTGIIACLIVVSKCWLNKKITMVFSRITAIILADIAFYLHLDNDDQRISVIAKHIICAKWNVDGMAYLKLQGLAIKLNGRLSGHDDPIFGSLMVILQRQMLPTVNRRPLYLTSRLFNRLSNIPRQIFKTVFDTATVAGSRRCVNDLFPHGLCAQSA